VVGAVGPVVNTVVPVVGSTGPVVAEEAEGGSAEPWQPLTVSTRHSAPPTKVELRTTVFTLFMDTPACRVTKGTHIRSDVLDQEIPVGRLNLRDEPALSGSPVHWMP
jgi:hypothetical protein